MPVLQSKLFSMYMPSLRDLHQSMLKISVDMQQFQITTGSASFDCLFSTREAPFVLALTSRGDKPHFFKFEVMKGYRIKPYFDRFYYELAKVLNNDLNTGKLEPKKFLEQLNAAVPTIAYKRYIPTEREIVRLRRDIEEERDKPYFDTWIYWTSEKRQNGARKDNQKKTLLLLGKDALQHSIKMKASSRWSSVDLGHNWKK